MKRMKRAFTTLACMDATIDEVIAYAKRNRIEGVEIRLDKDQKIIGYGISLALQPGMTMADLEMLSIGLINDMYAESRNDDCKYATLATQEDFDRF